MEPTDHGREDDWFRKNEQQLLEQARRAREERERQRASQETEDDRHKLKAAHWMKCPKCGHDLEEKDLSGVKVDRCTYCEGLFLDPGELEQLARKTQEERQGVFRRLLGI